MRKRADITEVEGRLTKEEFLERIKRWKETTTTSDFHLGYSKALIAKHNIPKEDPRHDQIEEKQSKLIDWQVRLINLALDNKYSYERWKTIVNFMILKEAGNYKIHRLRVIHLYEFDYNLVLSVKWRKLIQNSLHAGNLNKGQFGGVPGGDATVPTFIEEMQYEICRASRQPLVHLDFDATSCYDRIIANLASLLSRCHGMHKNICFVHARTLKEAKYKLRTQLGVSKEHYKHSVLVPLYRTGQGIGNSPMIWCLISVTLFEAY